MLADIQNVTKGVIMNNRHRLVKRLKNRLTHYTYHLHGVEIRVEKRGVLTVHKFFANGEQYAALYY